MRKTIERFGRIDFVICGEFRLSTLPSAVLIWSDHSIGAAGNFLAPLSGLSENAFKTVIEIDTVRMFSLLSIWNPLSPPGLARNVQYLQSHNSPCPQITRLVYPRQRHPSFPRYFKLTCVLTGIWPLTSHFFARPPIPSPCLLRQSWR